VCGKRQDFPTVGKNKVTGRKTLRKYDWGNERRKLVKGGDKKNIQRETVLRGIKGGALKNQIPPENPNLIHQGPFKTGPRGGASEVLGKPKKGEELSKGTETEKRSSKKTLRGEEIETSGINANSGGIENVGVKQGRDQASGNCKRGIRG